MVMPSRDTYIPPRYVPPPRVDSGMAPLTRRETNMNRHCRHIVVVEKAGAMNVDAEPTYGTPTEYPALVLTDPIKMRTIEGDEFISSAQILFAYPAPDVDARDRITLPSGAQPRILRTSRDADPSIHALVLYT